MRLDQRKEIGSVTLFSLIVVLIPLILYGIFPNALVFSVLAGRVYLLFLFEFIWYSIVLLITLRTASGWLLFFQALICILYRLGLGVSFGLLIVLGDTMSGIEGGLKEAIASGIWSYAPTVIIQVLVAPFVLRGFFNQMIREDVRKKEVSQHMPRLDVRPRKDKKEATQTKPAPEAEEIDLTSPLRYISEYSGVEGVFLVDNDGLIVAKESSHEIDGEKLAPFILGLEQLNNRALRKINEKSVSRIELYTPTRWINLTRTFSLVLVTVANRHTDGLLSVRIAQASEMIRKYMKKRYTQEVLLEAEEQNV